MSSVAVDATPLSQAFLAFESPLAWQHGFRLCARGLLIEKAGLPCHKIGPRLGDLAAKSCRRSRQESPSLTSREVHFSNSICRKVGIRC